MVLLILHNFLHITNKAGSLFENSRIIVPAPVLTKVSLQANTGGDTGVITTMDTLSYAA